jgi:ATP-dependent Lhr-like helicase
MASVFERLHPAIQEGLRKLGIEEPTPTQKAAIPPLLRGESLLLVAPTASGKTEAALLPIFDFLLKTQRRPGISVLYITPLRALNRDLYGRMIFWSRQLGIEIGVRHGDTSRGERRRQVSKPPQMLITTPETLQAILPHRGMRRHLMAVRWVVVDEIHEVASSKRGAQLAVGLERLEAITEDLPQRIGLSATIGEPEEMARFLGGSRPVSVVVVEAEKPYKYRVEYPRPVDEDFDLADELETTPRVASRLRRIKELVESHRSTLIFVQGRGQAETLGNRLWKVDPLIEVHHGSLSRETRHLIEDRFKKGELKGIVCTSTLQLGIDIGHVDLSIQFMSPRRVSTLIQRVGRSGHRLGLRSEGVIIATYSEDTLESIAAMRRAERRELEGCSYHLNPLDVLAHQIVGLTLDFEEIDLEEAYRLIRRSHPFMGLRRGDFDEVVSFLTGRGLMKEVRSRLRMTRRGRRYYYENLSMIPDERRYPFINAVTDRVIGTVGDEFWTLRARVGLNVILRGRVWRIIHIDEEEGALYVVPSEDPLGALPGWDGELIEVPREVAEEAANLRERIAEELRGSSKEGVVKALSEELSIDEEAIRAIVEEVEAHIRRGLLLPTNRRILLEAYDRYLIIHSPFGERINRTLGCIFDPILSEHDLIYTWWNDPYRILIEATRRLDEYDLQEITHWLFDISGEEAERRLWEYLDTRFPFGYKMKSIAERFGVIPRGKTLGSKAIEELHHRYRDTPIYRETLREAFQEKLDLDGAKRVITAISKGEIELMRVKTREPSPLARHILQKYADIEELMAPIYAVPDLLDYMKKSLEARTIRLLCLQCGWTQERRVRELGERPRCGRCGSGLLTPLERHRDPKRLYELLERWRRGEQLLGDEEEAIREARRRADLLLSYGRKAIIALLVHGIGPITAYRILSKMHREEKVFYKDLLKAKIQYLRTRPYWEEERPKEA